MSEKIKVWRFDDSVLRSHVMAETQVEAEQIFDTTMGVECREFDEDEAYEIYAIDGSEELLIDLGGCGTFTTKTADEWIEYNNWKPGLL